MTTDQLLEDIQIMKQELESSLAKTARGEDVDISKIPDKLGVLYQNAKTLGAEDTGELQKGLEELLTLLDNLSKEIQKKYEDLTQHINLLDV
ncbi:hypothetical protein [Sneathiella limimaris]|uniref:hypothetical protein n=1 Tax=Sneathiella limimaris TaxID=1964213 RepID=UPI00146E09A5|nr:hypothetical protein [Sneathiella limimaris]